MKMRGRIVASAVEILIGVVLLICRAANLVDDFWSGMGGALLIVGALNIIRSVKYRVNEEYRETVDVQVQDERNKYLSMKAWSWAGYFFVLIAAVCSILFRILKQDALSMAASYSVCLVLVLYWVSYLILRKKY